MNPDPYADAAPAWFFDADGHRTHISGQMDGTPGLRVVERRYPKGDAWQLTVRNDTRHVIHLEKAGATFHYPAGRRRRQWRVFLDPGACGWCGVKPLEALEADPRMQPIREQRLDSSGSSMAPAGAFHRSSLQTVIWDRLSGQAQLVGFLRQKQGYNFIDIVPDAAGSQVVRIEAWQDFNIQLQPGETQQLDVLAVAAGNDPYTLLEHFAQAVQRHTKKRFDAPPTVGMMTWYGYRTAIDQEIILENASLVSELFGGYDQPMQKLMLLDHGWQQDANWGHWEADDGRFPRGMSWLNKQLQRLGLELGLWYTPFCVSDNVPDAQSLHEMLCRDDDGVPEEGLGSVWGQLPGHPRSRRITYFDGALDVVTGKWRRELARMKRWGCTYWKLDFFSLRTSASRRLRLSMGALYQRVWPHLRDSAGDDGHLAPCSCGTNIQLGYCDSIRIGSDIGNSGHWPGAWDEYRYGLATIGALWYKHRRFWVNDPDSIQIGKGCSLNEARVRATMVSLSGGHLMISEDLRTLDPARLEIIRRLLPAQPRAARPLDLFENPFPDGYPSIWSLTTPSAIGRRTTLALFNLSEQTRSWKVTPQMLGISAGRRFVVREWWQQRWLGAWNETFEVEVCAEDVAVLHAQPVPRRPQILSASHHITGNLILGKAAFDRASGTLHGELHAKAGLRVVVSGLAPASWRLAMRATYHGASNHLGGWQYEVPTTGTRTPFTIPFERVSSAS